MTYRMDRTKLNSGSFEDSAEESKSFIKSTSAIERLQILEFLRAQTYAEPAPRLQRTIEVVNRSKS